VDPAPRSPHTAVSAGASGQRGVGGHSHNDKLSFELHLHGEPVIVDPGSPTYTRDPQLRNQFRSTAAHNTLRVDGQDQSEPGGSFMWLRKARAGCSHWSSADRLDVFEGWHDGYTRLSDPVFHRRRIVLDKLARRVLLEDRLEMSGTHEIELFFHCSERCRVERVDEGYRICGMDKTIVLKLPSVEGATTEVYTGSVAPVLGWISRRFDEKTAAPTIVWRARITGAALLSTEVYC